LEEASTIGSLVAADNGFAVIHITAEKLIWQ